MTTPQSPSPETVSTSAELLREVQVAISELKAAWHIAEAHQGTGPDTEKLATKELMEAKVNVTSIGQRIFAFLASQPVPEQSSEPKELTPRSKKWSDLPVEGIVMLEPEMREWAQARDLQIFHMGETCHVMQGQKFLTEGHPNAKAALEALRNSGVEVEIPRCKQSSQMPDVSMTLTQTGWMCSYPAKPVNMQQCVIAFGETPEEAYEKCMASVRFAATDEWAPVASTPASRLRAAKWAEADARQRIGLHRPWSGLDCKVRNGY